MSPLITAGRRVILIILDSLGVGAMDDASLYGDEGANTFLHIQMKKPDLEIPNLTKMGFTCLPNLGGDPEEIQPKAMYGRAREKSPGKDTITGHWEIAGIITETPFQTFTDTGFPQSFIEAFEKEIGIGVLGNYAASGTEIIKEMGKEHEATGKPIVYTSADSVFQIAANTAVIPLEQLYEMCSIARSMLVNELLIGRVIARPFVEKDGEYIRTADRKDYALDPPEKTILDSIQEEGMVVYAIGKIKDIFNGKGISESVHTKNNAEGIEKTLQAMDQVEEGLIFVNLVDFDSKYGHRRDPEGYALAIEEFDQALPQIEAKMKEDDLLILCADHGNDPTFRGWNHTREMVPIICYNTKMTSGISLGDRDSFADIGASILKYLGIAPMEAGDSFI